MAVYLSGATRLRPGGETLRIDVPLRLVLNFRRQCGWKPGRLKQMALALPEGQVKGHAIVGALSLYLDFINLFLMLLRFTGRRN